jgi:hypothetical protein
VQLNRTESAAYQDELYNPANFTAPPTRAPPTNTRFLTPHRNLIHERLQTANITRSVPPSSASRVRSPFKHGSPLAPAPPRVGTYDGIRQQQKEKTAKAEMVRHRSQLHREPTKTISPKDALLDYTDTDQPTLFQDTVPTEYKQHFGSTEQSLANFFSQGNTSSIGDLPTSQPNVSGFPRDIEKSHPHLSKQRNASSLGPTGERVADSTSTSLGSGSSAATPDDRLQSPSPHNTRPGLSSYSAPVPCALGHEECFPIDILQELGLYFFLVPVGSNPLRLRVSMEESWDSVESLLHDSKHVVDPLDRSSLVFIWSAMVRTMTTGPPGIPEDMFSVHLRYPAKTPSVWIIDFERTEDKIVGHWRPSASPVSVGHAHTRTKHGITVSALP